MMVHMVIVNTEKEWSIKIIMIQLFFLTILCLVTSLVVCVAGYVSALFHNLLSAKFWIVFN